MPAHCHCDDHEKDPYIQKEEIHHGVPDKEAPHVSRHKMCRNCTGLIRVLA